MSFMDDPGGQSLDRKLAQLRADFGEDIAVYDFDDDGLQNLSGALEEDMNDFNDETFGIDSVGKDFDFSGSTAQYLGATGTSQPKPSQASTWTTMPSLLADHDPGGHGAATASSQRRPSGGISLNEDPLLGPISHSSHRPPPSQSSQTKQPPSAANMPQGMKIRTLEEIEEELRANAAAKASALTSQAPRALTLEEVEAALLATSREKQAAATTMGRASTPLGPSLSQSSLQTRAHLAQQAQMQQVAAAQRNANFSAGSPPMMSSIIRNQTPSSLPALTHPAHPAHPQHSEWLRLQQQQQQMYTNVPSQTSLLQNLPARIPVAHPSPQALAHRRLPSPPTSGYTSTMRMPAKLPMSPASQSALAYLPAGAIPVEELRSVAEARIQEHERQEALRRRKAAKIAEMARYNNLMSQGDKDFITRIQVSQLVNPSHGQAGFDPYADDFYFHVYSAIRASRIAIQQQAQAAAADRRMSLMASGGSLGGEGPSVNEMQTRSSRTSERRLTRRDHAMIRMAQNVQRIIDHAKKCPKMSQVSLEGALGKIALRTRSAPRQMLQVQPAESDNLATAAGGENHPGILGASLPKTVETTAGQPSMYRRQTLMSLERLYSTVLEVEQLRRTQPPLPPVPSETEAQNNILTEWETQYETKKDKLWKQLRVLDPLDISHPHPFVSFLCVAKGKRLLPRVIRLFTHGQCLQVLTLLVATFETIDVVRDAPLLDLPSDPHLAGPYPRDRRSRAEVELETDLFINCVVAPMMAVINQVSLELVTGLVSLLLDRNDLMFIARSRPGIAFLTLFLSRAELLKNASLAEVDALNTPPGPTTEAIMNWQLVFDQLFNRLSADFSSLFPSTRSAAALPMGNTHLFGPDAMELSAKYIRPGLDLEDEPVWQLMAALAVSTDSDGQQVLVGGLRDKVLENVTAVGKKWVSEEIGVLKIRNVNLMLHALGLDASMITL